MLKEFYRNKNGTHWRISDRKMYGMPIKNQIKNVEFYPFPTLRFKYLECKFTRTNNFNVEFIWLFWEIHITRYWGEAYKEQMELLKNDAER